jgi:endogenous inhibitor of DNA gyrase (YacG/DUF329 family)
VQLTGGRGARTLTVPCPNCKAPALYAPENRFRPFCSARCRGIDFGAWATEAYRVPGDAPADPDTDLPPEPRGPR